jgi:CMP-N-acetylneuraminic acid synthetase
MDFMNINKFDSKLILGVTLARGGSKSIPNKNTADLAGKPLIAYTVQEAIKSKYITNYIVSTDNLEIKKIAEQFGATVPFLRPKNLATDLSTSADALMHALMFMENKNKLKYDLVIELMATNPFKTSEDIDQCIELLIDKDCDSVIAMNRLLDHHPARIKKIIKGKIYDFCQDEVPESRRQDLRPYAYVRSGAIYALNRDWFVANKKRYGSNNSYAYILDDEKAVNIDSKMDLGFAKFLMSQKV